MGVKRGGQEARSHASNLELIVISQGKLAWDLGAHCYNSEYFCTQAITVFHPEATF